MRCGNPRKFGANRSKTKLSKNRQSMTSVYWRVGLKGLRSSLKSEYQERYSYFALCPWTHYVCSPAVIILLDLVRKPYFSPPRASKIIFCLVSKMSELQVQNFTVDGFCTWPACRRPWTGPPEGGRTRPPRRPSPRHDPLLHRPYPSRPSSRRPPPLGTTALPPAATAPRATWPPLSHQRGWTPGELSRQVFEKIYLYR